MSSLPTSSVLFLLLCSLRIRGVLGLFIHTRQQGVYLALQGGELVLHSRCGFLAPTTSARSVYTPDLMSVYGMQLT